MIMDWADRAAQEIEESYENDEITGGEYESQMADLRAEVRADLRSAEEGE